VPQSGRKLAPARLRDGGGQSPPYRAAAKAAADRLELDSVDGWSGWWSGVTIVTFPRAEARLSAHGGVAFVTAAVTFVTRAEGRGRRRQDAVPGGRKG
jgi:hypothetical protein